MTILANSAINSEPLSKMTLVGHGYLHSQVCSTKLAMVSALLSLIVHSSNHPVAGSIIVRHQRIKFFLEFCFIVYGPMRSTHRMSQGMASASFSGRCPYFFVCLLLS